MACIRRRRDSLLPGREPGRPSVASSGPRQARPSRRFADHPYGKAYIGGGAAGVLCVEVDKVVLEGKTLDLAELQKVMADMLEGIARSTR